MIIDTRSHPWTGGEVEIKNIQKIKITGVPSLPTSLYIIILEYCVPGWAHVFAPCVRRWGSGR